jgi:ABC-type Na+ transport system ATPase subunit NatA
MLIPAIQVQDLVKARKKRGGETVYALDDVFFSVQRGEIFGLLDPNGAEKQPH